MFFVKISVLVENAFVKLVIYFEETPMTIYGLTMMDPCNVVRGRGLDDMLRYVVHELCDNVIEMYPNREHNFCCNAGGGVINCGPPFKNKRVNSNRIKAEQCAATGAEILLTPCHKTH